MLSHGDLRSSAEMLAKPWGLNADDRQLCAALLVLPDLIIDEDSVIAALQQRMACYKQPERVLFLNTIPRNVMDKVQKNLRRERF